MYVHLLLGLDHYILVHLLKHPAPDVVSHACDSREAEAAGPRIQSQPGLHQETWAGQTALDYRAHIVLEEELSSAPSTHDGCASVGREFL